MKFISEISFCLFKSIEHEILLILMGRWECSLIKKKFFDNFSRRNQKFLEDIWVKFKENVYKLYSSFYQNYCAPNLVVKIFYRPLRWIALETYECDTVGR